jgi:hypothetical protein
MDAVGEHCFNFNLYHILCGSCGLEDASECRIVANIERCASEFVSEVDDGGLSLVNEKLAYAFVPLHRGNMETCHAGSFLRKRGIGAIS